MAIARQQAALVLATALYLSIHSSHLPSCGPLVRTTVFTYRQYPAITQDRYVAGDLGVIFPTFWRKFLVVAYRYLEGAPLTGAEQKAFLGAAPTPAEPWIQAGNRWVARPVQLWLEARGRVEGAGEAERIEFHRKVPGSEWQVYLNCAFDAFATAARTLDARIAEFGPSHRGVRSWLRAQDAVFSNCGSGATMPGGPEPDLPPILQADRAYQRAAALFYSEQFAEAAEAFGQIAGDESSPWRDIAPYLKARCWIRQATLDPRPGHVNGEALSRAAGELRQVLQDDGRREIHGPAKRLLDYVRARLEPGNRLAEVATEVSSATDDTVGFAARLIDFQYLMDRGAGNEEAARSGSDLVDWIVTFQNQSPESLAHAIERWKASNSTAWLVAALVQVKAGHTDAAALIGAAERLEAASPAFPTAAYHRVRLLVEAAKRDQARETLDRLLPQLEDAAPPAAVNLFYGQRMELARNLDEFLRYAPRQPIALQWDALGEQASEPVKSEEPGQRLDSDSIEVFNRGLPLRLLAEASRSEFLPESVRACLAQTTWVRAILLDQWDVAEKLAPELRRQFPALADTLKSVLSAGAEDRRFAAAWLLLRHPGLKPYLLSSISRRQGIDEIDNLRDNWWCSFRLEERLDGVPIFRYWRSSNPRAEPASPPTAPPDFLSPGDRGHLEEEWERLLGLDTAPNYLGRIVCEFAAKNPEDPRVPEALHLAVKATRYGCTDANTARYSRQAFRLLHQRYSDTEWAKRTPYWFR